MLIARSERMRAALHTSGMLESRLSEIAMTGMSSEVFKELLKFLYGDVITEVTKDNPEMLMQLLVVANENTLLRLSRLCEGALLRLLHPENAAEFFEFADIYGERSVEDESGMTGRGILRQGALSFVLRHFLEVKETEGYKELSPRLLQDIEATQKSTNVYQDFRKFK